MPSPEQYYQRRPASPVKSPRLQAVITDLAEYQEVDLSQANARFSIARPDQEQQWVVSNHEGQIDVACCATNDDFMVPDIDVLLSRTPTVWATEQVVYSDATWQAYAEATDNQADPAVHFPFFAFSEYVAQLIAAEAQAEQANDGTDLDPWLTSE